MAVYILHFDEPIGGTSKRGKAQHYVGCTKDTVRRFTEHFNLRQNGSPLVAAVIERGIKVNVAAVMDGGFDLERKIKAAHNTSRHCPICQERGE